MDRRLTSFSDMGDQVKKSFENLGVVLQAAGLTAHDVVRVNYYTTDVDELITVLGPLRSEFFGNHLPTLNASRRGSAGLSTAQDRDRKPRQRAEPSTSMPDSACMRMLIDAASFAAKLQPCRGDHAGRRFPNRNGQS